MQEIASRFTCLNSGESSTEAAHADRTEATQARGDVRAEHSRRTEKLRNRSTQPSWRARTMHLGIVAAFDREARMLTGRAGLLRDFQGQAQVAIAGMGADRARAAGERLLNSGATALLSWGVAAALDRELEPGSLLMPRTIVATDLSERAVSPDWHSALCARLADKFVIHTEPLAESTLVLSTPAQKRALLLRSMAVAADMESAALAALAQTAHVPFVAIRAVSDRADTRVPLWLSAVVDGAGRLSLRRVIKDFLLRPRDWVAVSHVASGFCAARATLTGVARQAGISLMAGVS